MFIFEKKHLRKIYYILLVIVLATSCSREKDSNLNFNIFDSNTYQSLDVNNKIYFLDSVFLANNYAKNDSLNRNFLFDLSTEYYYLNQSKKSFKVCKKALELTSYISDSLGMAKSYYFMGDCYEVNHKDSAYFYYKKAQRLYHLLDDNEMEAKMLFRKAYLLFFEGNYLESEIIVSSALQLLNKSDNNKLIFDCYNLIGSNFVKLEEYDESLKYYLLAQSKLEDLIKNDIGFDIKNNYKVSLSVNIAIVYYKKNQFIKAKNELESILTPDLKDKWPNDYATVIGNLGYVKMKLGNLKEGEALLKEAFNLSKQSGIESSIVYKLTNLGEFYAIAKDTTQSIRYLKESSVS